MNICFYTIHEINPHIGGVEKITYNLAHFLRNKGFNIYYFHSNGTDKKNHFILPKNSNKKQVCLYIDQIIEEHKIDIIIDQYGTCNYFSHENLKSKVIIIRCWHLNVIERHITKCLLETFPHKRNRERLLNVLFWLNTPRRRYRLLQEFKYSVYNTDKLLLLSESYKSYLSKHFPKHKMEVISNSIYLPTIDDISTTKENIIMYCGRIVHNPKNILFLIYLWEHIYKNNPNWEMIITGDGEDRYILENLIKRKRLPKISITGFTKPDEYYKKAKILVLPSYNEGFGMVLIEAMAEGCVPIVFNTSPAFQDIINNNINGLIIPNLNKKAFCKSCESLMQNNDLFFQMSSNARNRAKDYSIEKIGNKWVNLFNNLTHHDFNNNSNL